MEGLKKAECQPGVGFRQMDVRLLDESGTGTKDVKARGTQVLPRQTAAPGLPATCQPSPDLPQASAQLCSPGFQRGGSHRAPFTPCGFHGTHVRGFGSRKAGPQPAASAMSPAATPKRALAPRVLAPGTEPTEKTAPREGGRG